MAPAAAEPAAHRSGFVAVVGAPNAGKSTLVNALVGRKVAGVSAKPQTTRRRIMGVRTEPGCQMIFVDTPGVAEADSKLGEFMRHSAATAAREADVLVGVADVTRAGDVEVAAGLTRGRRAPAILVLNKVDLVPKPALLPLLAKFTSDGTWLDVVPISARTGDGTDLVRGLIRDRLPEGPVWYEEGQDPEPPASIVQEIIQERLFVKLRQEVPYGTAVRVEAVESEGALLRVTATILVERESHKGILVGAKGSMIKEIGMTARLELEKVLTRKVYLDLRVKVEEKWRDRADALADLGYVAARKGGEDVV